MIEYDPPKPSFFKAWFVVCVFAAPVVWSVWALTKFPHIPLIVLAIAASIIGAYTVYNQMTNDWRASDTLAERNYDYYTGSHMQKGLKDRE
ncbi:MAG: hypothetical protein JO177_01190 [Candidatus Eremiobacteraeota bacterium]|nr:hypothetical protein [Candidatus Eremiobacteraeota bacterium]